MYELEKAHAIAAAQTSGDVDLFVAWAGGASVVGPFEDGSYGVWLGADKSAMLGFDVVKAYPVAKNALEMAISGESVA